jgi:pilus assembly protein FimV
MEEPLYLAAAGAAIVLGGVGFLLVRRRRAAERAWQQADDDEDRVAPTLGGSTEDESTASALFSPERPREVPTARGERPQPAPPAATAAIVAALATGRKEAGADDNDLDFHGKRDARGRNPVSTIERSARPAQATGEPAVAPTAKDQAETPQPPPPGAGRQPPNLPQSGAGREPSKLPPVPDFALDEPPSTPTGGEGRAKPSHELDFDLDPLPAIDTGKVAPAGRPNVDFKLDLDDLDLNAPGQRSGDAGRDAHWHDVQQKFDLAKAYEDMGDKQGARDILQEVIREGDTAQQVQARRRLELLS